MTTSTNLKPLGELYLGTLAQDSSYYTLAGTIASAITDASHPVDSAAILARHAMGTLELCISMISEDQLHCEDVFWARIDAFFDNASNDSISTDPAELAWVIKELRQKSYRVLETWEDHAVCQRIADAQRGIDVIQGVSQERHGLWIAELHGVGHLLQAASKVLQQLNLADLPH